ncbi:MAG TPA: hypothetical protein VGJ26_06100 [Pirellulales bacterium]|jgi:hypothetical protein
MTPIVAIAVNTNVPGSGTATPSTNGEKLSGMNVILSATGPMIY